MLTELLQGNDIGCFLLIQDSCSFSGRRLLKSFLSAALNREEAVHVLEFDVSEEELDDGLKTCQRLHIYNAYADPLRWNDGHEFSVHKFNSSTLTQLVKNTKPATLVIDSLSWILRHVNPTDVCQTLQQLKKGGAVKTLIALLHADMHSRVIVGSISRLATVHIIVAPGTKGDEALAKITKRSKSGKVVQNEETFNIKEDLSVVVQSKSSTSGHRHSGAEEQGMDDPQANLTFNLRLTDEEREAKEKLALPFVFSKEKKTALLHSGPGSGRILYEPDANDDFDQEDPDDDLDV